MSTISPIIADAFDLLRTDLYAHLDEAELLASKAEGGRARTSDLRKSDGRRR